MNKTIRQMKKNKKKQGMKKVIKEKRKTQKKQQEMNKLIREIKKKAKRTRK